MRIDLLLLGLLLSVSLPLFSQSSKKRLDHEDFAIWKTIASPGISYDGEQIVYQLEPGEGDPALYLYTVDDQQERVFPRGKSPGFSADSRVLVFRISPQEDSLKAMRRRKVKKTDLPKDSLGIYFIGGELEKLPNVKAYVLPDKWPGWLAYHLHPAKKDSTNKDQKKQNGENGSPLVIRNLENGAEDTLHYATSVVAAEENPGFLAVSTGDEGALEAGVYYFDTEAGNFRPVYTGAGKFSSLTFDEAGRQAAFLADLDTTEARVRYPRVGYWSLGEETARWVADQDLDLLTEGWRISPDESPRFSRDGSTLYFGIGKEPILEDTSLLEEEVVQVEVWTWQDAELYPMQKLRAEREKKRAYLTAMDLESGAITPLGTEAVPDIDLGDEGNAEYVLGTNDRPYYRSVSWEGGPARQDVYLIDRNSGEQTPIKEALRASPRFSPGASYVYWYHRGDSAWSFHSVESGLTLTIHSNEKLIWYDEENDRPMDASSYGAAGWLENDAAILLYDRYDIWRFDPSGQTPSQRLTQGRENRISYRYIDLDREDRFIPSDGKLLLYLFNEVTKGSGYAWLDLASGEVEEIIQSPDHRFGRNVRKAKNAEQYLFTRENTVEFPDLYTSPDMLRAVRVSEANPQQEDYNWCTKEIFEWADMDGITRQGLVVKPEDFDPDKQYPTIVYFYERYSDNLHRHYHPYPVRSTINFTWYASRGYVIFIPDIWYKEGYPGKSAYDAVMSGTLALLEEGYVDRDRLGIQGHSWGGYQDAYIITQTDLFKCAESGAPVVNMTSAYGGIRWGSGMSRMFQYEHTQSRIGGTLWEYPMRYIENSPLFYLEKVNTPVLILHNDEDGAVPWYQGIEFFVGLRRLGKPAWLLNYNGEPHWPVKLQNRKDFQKRMQQFFDHYLMDAPKPQWMERGVPAIEKGIEQGYELMKE